MAEALGGRSTATQPLARRAADGAPTVVLDRTDDPTAVLEPTGPSPAERVRAPKRLLTVLLIAAVLVVAIAALAAVVISNGRTTAGTPPAPASSAAASGVPAPLQDALDRLQETIAP
jgi:hypothetical protein